MVLGKLVPDRLDEEESKISKEITELLDDMAEGLFLIWEITKK